MVATLRSDWITTGPKVREFERSFASRVGAPAALALSSCTAAMQVALKAMGVGPGDAVLTTPMTFCSTVHSIEHAGAVPVLVDIDPVTMNIHPDRLLEAIDAFDTGHPQKVAGWAGALRASSTPLRPRAVLPVHFAGHPCDQRTILDLARARQLSVVEDAAHALPASCDGRMIGEVDGDPERAVCFSFYATKNLTTAEGGMLTGSPALVEEARTWSLHGMSHDAWDRYGEKGSWYYEVVRAGFKCNMTDIQASLGLQQLRKLESFQRRRRLIAQRYGEAFGGLDEVEVPVELDEVTHAWHLFVLRLRLERLTISRERFISEMKARHIGTSVHFIPIHVHPYYQQRYGFTPEDFPVAVGQYQRVVSLPIYPRMSDQDVEDVIDAVMEVVTRYGRVAC